MTWRSLSPHILGVLKIGCFKSCLYPQESRRNLSWHHRVSTGLTPGEQPLSQRSSPRGLETTGSWVLFSPKGGVVGAWWSKKWFPRPVQSTGELHMLPSFQPIDPLGRAGDGKDPHGGFWRVTSRKTDSTGGPSIGCPVICILRVVFRHSHKLAR